MYRRCPLPSPPKLNNFCCLTRTISLSLSLPLLFSSCSFPLPFVPFVVLDIAGARVSFTLQTFSNLSLFEMSTSKENQNEIRHASKKNVRLGGLASTFDEFVDCPRFHRSITSFFYKDLKYLWQ